MKLMTQKMVKGDGQVFQVEIPAEGIVEPFDANIEQAQDTGPDNLAQEFSLRRQGVLVIQDAQDDDPRAAQQDTEDILRQGDTQDHGKDGGQINSQPAKPRHDVRMDFALVGTVYRPDAERQLLHVGREQKTGQQCDNEG